MRTLLTLMAAVALASPANAAVGQTEMIRKANPPAVAKPLGAYSHLAVVPAGSRLLYLAGQIGNRPDGTLATTYEEQSEQAWANVLAILRSEGAGPEHIVKIMTYAAVRPTDPGRLGTLRGTIFKGMMPPPSTIAYVSGLARRDILVEVEVIAALPHK